MTENSHSVDAEEVPQGPQQDDLPGSGMVSQESTPGQCEPDSAQLDGDNAPMTEEEFLSLHRLDQQLLFAESPNLVPERFRYRSYPRRSDSVGLFD